MASTNSITSINLQNSIPENYIRSNIHHGVKQLCTLLEVLEIFRHLLVTQLLLYVARKHFFKIFLKKCFLVTTWTVIVSAGSNFQPHTDVLTHYGFLFQLFRKLEDLTKMKVMCAQFWLYHNFHILKSLETEAGVLCLQNKQLFLDIINALRDNIQMTPTYMTHTHTYTHIHTYKYM